MKQHGSRAIFFSLSLVLMQTMGIAVAQEKSERFERITQRLVQAINAQDHSSIRQDFSKAMLNALTLEKSKSFFAKVVAQFGKIEKLEPPQLTAPNQAVFVARCTRGNMDISVVLDEQDKIDGLSLLPSKQTLVKITRRLVQAINVQDHHAIRRDFSKAMLDDLTLDKSKTLFTRMLTQFGKIKKLDSPQFTAPNRAIFVAHCARGNLDITVAMDENDKIAMLSFLPSKQSPTVPHKLFTSFRLPFDGRWLVLWGGESREQNHHHDSPHQRFAFDFLVVDQAGRSHKGEGKENKDYYAFGRPVLAPADGVVSDVITGIRDNTPGSMNPAFAGGNTVVLMHKEHEVSVISHLQQGSIKVKCGDKVKQGQVLGLCGNSGNSSEPHIHFHVQDTPIIQDGTSLQCMFEKITVTKNGKSESKMGYSPVKGDIVKGK